MLERGKMERDVIEIVGIDSLVPQDHLLRKIDRAVDFNRLYEMVEPLYCEDNGRPSIDPVVLFKMVLIQHLYGLPSLRRTAEEIRGSIYYRWFLGYSLQEETPHFSTVSYNFRHRFTEETVMLLVQQRPDDIVRVGIDTDELSVTKAESKATYGEIQARVKAQTGLNVTPLYIAQVKRKHGIIERECYNKAKADNPKMHLCPPDKEAAIEEALRFFGMIA